MLPSFLPDWLRVRIVEVVQAYRTTIELCEKRCNQLVESGTYADECGTVDEYRMDAKYCAGAASRLPALIEDALTIEEVRALVVILKGQLEPIKPGEAARELHELEMGPEVWREVATDPERLAPWAWRKPMKPPEPTPEPEQAIPDYRVTELLQPLTQREAEALILCKVCLLTDERAGQIMGIRPDSVRKLVKQAKDRLELERMIEQQKAGRKTY